MTMKIRLIGTPEEIDQGVDHLRTVYKIRHRSDPKPCDRSPTQVRVYLAVSPLQQPNTPQAATDRKAWRGPRPGPPSTSQRMEPARNGTH